MMRHGSNPLLLALLVWSALGASSAGQSTMGAKDLKEKLVSLKAQGFNEKSLVAYLGQVVLAAPLTPKEMSDWKDSGLAETVIRAAMARAGNRAVTVAVESKLVPVEVTVDPIVFHSVRVQLGSPKKGMVKVTLVVKASNPGTRDRDGVVTATLLNPDGSMILFKRGQRQVEEGQKNKDIKLELQVPETAIKPDVRCRLEFSVS